MNPDPALVVVLVCGWGLVLLFSVAGPVFCLRWLRAEEEVQMQQEVLARYRSVFRFRRGAVRYPDGTVQPLVLFSCDAGQHWYVTGEDDETGTRTIVGDVQAVYPGIDGTQETELYLHDPVLYRQLTQWHCRDHDATLHPEAVLRTDWCIFDA